MHNHILIFPYLVLDFDLTFLFLLIFSTATISSTKKEDYGGKFLWKE